MIGGREIHRQAVPAEDMMQAFIYRHLVPADDWMVAVTEGRRFRSPLRLLDRDPVKLPAGGTARVRLSAPRAPILDQVQLALSDPPEGIAIQGMSRVIGGVAIELQADAEKVQPGLKGNLLVNAFIERTFGRAGGTQPGNKRRIPIGTLPAIPFEIVEPQ
jgi:hypothetical protein